MNLRWRLSHIRGYLALGMIRQAAEELKALHPAHADLLEVKVLEVAILHEKRSWRRLRRLAGELARQQPDHAEWWVSLAYATRRVVSVEEARRVLLKAEKLHPAEPVIQFNLGCYACQLGDLKEARERVARAIQLDSAFKKARDEDPDLEPLRASEQAI